MEVVKKLARPQVWLLLMLSATVSIGIYVTRRWRGRRTRQPRGSSARSGGHHHRRQNNAVDAGGNAFVVAEPTDKSAPDYAAKKKAFDEFQARRPRSRWR